MKAIAIITALALLLAGPAQTQQEESTAYMEMAWTSSSDEIRRTLPIEYQANACGMTAFEFEYMARTIEAESDRTDSLEGKIHIAAVILNRVAAPEFPDTITGVLDQSGQFTTTSGGWCSTPYTETSRWAIVEAQRRLVEGTIPERLLYFNAIGYNNGQAFGYIDGNYFMTA